MLFNRKKGREATAATDVQRLKQEIRAELARIHGGYQEPEPIPQVEPPQAIEDVADQPALHHDPSPPTPAPRLHSVTASPLIQKAALSQIVGAPAQASNGSHHEADSPLGAFRHLVERFEVAASRIEAQVDRIERIGSRPADAARSPAAPSSEPRFPADAALRVTLASVPNFQALMDVQRALGAMSATGEATVDEFEHGNASIQIALRAPLSLSEIMEALRDAGGHPLLVEESRPEASRLRLRFIPPQTP